MDASDDKNRAIASKYGVQGFPTLKVHVGTGAAIDYQQARDARTMKSFLLSKLPSHVTRLTKDKLDSFLTKHSDKPKAIIFSKQGTISPTVKRFSALMKNFMKFGSPKKSDVKDIAKKYGLSTKDGSVVIVFPPGETTNFKQFSGNTKSFKEVQSWLYSFTPGLEMDDSEALPKLLDQSCFVQKCEKKGLCVILIRGEDEADYNKMHTILSEIRDTADDSSLFAFSQITASQGENYQWIQTLFGNLDTYYSNIIVLAPIKKRYAHYVGSVTGTAIKGFISGILTGKTRTAPIASKEMPKLAEDSELCPKPKPKPKPKKESFRTFEPSKKPIKTASKTETKKHIITQEKEEKTIENTKEIKKKKKSRKVKWDAHDPREHLNLVLIGHVDAGKSTISGQILLATDQIDSRTILKYKKEAKEKNRESWWIAYIMDEDDEERNKGKTVECGRAHFDTNNKRYTILDAPGHKNYVPNMISGAQQADVAILVISARRGEFEAGFDRGGQTREHALLALTLGISRIVIVVNKMDTMQWSKERYDDIKTRVTAFLCETGFKKKYIDILPISGQDATNIKIGVTKDICAWFKGPTLIETLDSLKKVKRHTGDTVRIPILDRYKGDKGIQAIGKVEAGIIRVRDQIMIMPSEVSATIVGLCIDDEQVDSAGAGENILITFDKNTVSMDQIYSGCVICGIDKPTKVVETFEAEIYIHEIPGGGIMTIGYQAMFHSHNVSTMCEIEGIPHRLHKKTRKRSKIAPRLLRPHDSAVVKIKLDQKCALEPYQECGALGRFTLRDSGKTVVIGKITKIYASKSRIKSNKYLAKKIGW
eukprot:148538_1